jgi:hypothetical protein
MLNLRRTWVRVLLAVIDVVVGLVAAWCLARPATQLVHSVPLPQVGPPLPTGAAACRVIYPEIKEPFNAAARGTPLTSCPFAEQVRRAAHADGFSVNSPSRQLRVVSPTNRKWYEMQCISAGRYATCTGGNDAVVYLFNTP